MTRTSIYMTPQARPTRGSHGFASVPGPLAAERPRPRPDRGSRTPLDLGGARYDRSSLFIDEPYPCTGGTHGHGTPHRATVLWPGHRCARRPEAVRLVRRLRSRRHRRVLRAVGCAILARRLNVMAPRPPPQPQARASAKAA